ncbi:hypothetical protein INT45_002806 [Circinella minor]|uniref:MULE transposase domain-containing protein n=1 Tax=Circinella minor TaxID=1195481 RepID=A0A8H7RYJ8_9FUNG|nr:hypothetical protein INT45_002806 [Circinella minor]
MCKKRGFTVVVASPNTQSLNVQLPVPSFPPTPTIRPTYITEPMTPTQQSILTSFYNIVPKDIYNLGQKIRANKNKRGNYQEMDLIMTFLQQNGYISRYDTDSTRKIIKSIFATHGTCIEKARRFPDVIVIDCTYRSNRNMMPPLNNIIGISNLGADNYQSDKLRLYYIGSAVMSDEKAISYNWVIEQLVKTIWTPECESTPRLFVTDNDSSLEIALRTHFPNVPHILCVWHIKKIFCEKVSKHIDKEELKEKCDEIIEIVNNLLWSRTMDQFNNAVKEYKDKVTKACSDNTAGANDIIAYLEEMLLYKERWAGPWIECHVHLGARSSQRVEGFNANLKKIIERPGRMLHTFQSIHEYLDTANWKEDLQQNREEMLEWVIQGRTTPNDNRLKNQVAPLRRIICNFAIYMTVKEIQAARYINENTIECGIFCKAKTNYNLPCRHKLYQFNSTSLYPELYNKRWWLVSPTDNASNESHSETTAKDKVEIETDDDLQTLNMYQEMKEKITSAYISCQNNQQRQDLIGAIDSALKKFSPVPIEKLALPKSVKTKGRPPKKAIGSRIPSSWKKSKKEVEEKQKYNYISNLYRIIHPDIPAENTIEEIKIVDDGWCGFRTLAYIVYKDQEKYLDVKEKMYSYVKDNRDICIDYICNEYSVLYDGLGLLQRMSYGVAPQLRTRSACCKKYWFDLALDIQVAANTFSLPLASYSDSIHESELYPPYDMPATTRNNVFCS